MLNLGRKKVVWLDRPNHEKIIVGNVTINNDIVSIDNGKIIIFKERIVSISDEEVIA